MLKRQTLRYTSPWVAVIYQDVVPTGDARLMGGA